MGYHTNFDGIFVLDKPLKPEHAKYLAAFAQTRRQRRDEKLTATRPDPIRIAAGLPVGNEGAYFVGETGTMGQDTGFDVLLDDYKNMQPCDQPGPWCQWTPVNSSTPWNSCGDINDENAEWDDFDAIGWDQGEKFYSYIEWLGYIITHFLQPWGYTLNGDVTWDGEERDDVGVIEVVDNVISVHTGVLSLDEVKEIEKTKKDKKNMIEMLEHFAIYLIDAEADDFCGQLYGYAFKEKDEEKAREVQESLEETILNHNEGPEHILSEIRKHLEEEPNHIYINILEALVLVNREREFTAS